MPTVYGNSNSGNCHKVSRVLDTLGMVYDWVEVDTRNGGSRTPFFLTINPAGQVPAVVLDDGRTLAQSNAILAYFAAGSQLLPTEPYALAKVNEWLFWEQYSHEPYVAVARHQIISGRASHDSLDPVLKAKAFAALAFLEAALDGRDWLANDAPSIADIALCAYTRLAPEAGFFLAPYPNLMAWVARCDARFCAHAPA
jgi:glutathione S-transferase